MATSVRQDQPHIKPVTLKQQPISNRTRFLRTFIRNRVAVVGFVIILLMALGAVFAPLIAPYDPIEPHYSTRLAPPGAQFFLGSDELGRDVFSRLLYGARISLVIGFVAQTVSITIGIMFGLV